MIVHLTTHARRASSSSASSAAVMDINVNTVGQWVLEIADD
jgi:hypothetical protein